MKNTRRENTKFYLVRHTFVVDPAKSLPPDVRIYRQFPPSMRIAFISSSNTRRLLRSTSSCGLLYSLLACLCFLEAQTCKMKVEERKYTIARDPIPIGVFLHSFIRAAVVRRNSSRFCRALLIYCRRV